MADHLTLAEAALIDVLGSYLLAPVRDGADADTFLAMAEDLIRECRREQPGMAPVIAGAERLLRIVRRGEDGTGDWAGACLQTQGALADVMRERAMARYAAWRGKVRRGAA